ncbi:MAG TPA: hypothetical protein RMH80_17670, partial [Polyangiaceae bacterium LLY-WYZ-15_(1-7)]|nr:hypothetical protein [Polyangiaceae bacterium LLY-WYZ-15_(1-7)]
MKAEHLRRASRWGGVALTASLVATYAASLGGGFLNYDDPWLIEANPWLRAGLGDALTAFFFDLRPRTRLQLGAEYLPLRDLSMWLDVALFGLRPQAMRAVQLGLYVVACLAFRAAFRRTLGPLRGELWAWLFALHTVHVESVAWLAGRKDVLALLFMGLALWRHARDGRDARVSVPLLWLAACLSKSMSVGFIGPLLAMDLLLGRRPDLRRHGLGAILVGSVLAVHVYVGGLVEMVGGPLEGDRFRAAQVMGEVWLRYARISLDPSASNLRHDIPAPEGWGASLAGWALLLGWGGAALAAWLRGRRSGPDRGSVALAAWLWFAVP